MHMQYTDLRKYTHLYVIVDGRNLVTSKRTQWRNDGVAAAFSDGAPLVEGTRQREKRPEGAPT